MIELSSEHIADFHRDGFSKSQNGVLSPAKQLVIANWLIIIAAGIFITDAMWSPGLLWGHSAWHDLTRTIEFNAAIRRGDLFPMWSPDFYHGYGSPLFQFYSPLVYFLVEVPLLLGIDLESALKLTFVILLITSGLTMYQLVSANMSRWAGTFAAVLYMIAPYRMLDLYARHALAEHAAFTWLPLIVLGTQQFVMKGRPAAAVITVIATAGLILTHNVTALIGLPVCVLSGWLLSGCGRSAKTILRAFCPVLGVGVAAFFWWPAFSARHLVLAKESLTNGYFDFHQHFIGPLRLVGLDQTATDQMPLSIGWIHLALATGALAFLLNRKWRTPWSVVGVSITAVGLLMCEKISSGVWQMVPLLSYVQFPWRFLSLAVFGIAMCGATVIHRIESVNARLALPFVLAGIVSVLSVYFPTYSAAKLLAADRSTGAISEMTTEQTNALEVSHRLIRFDELVTPNTMRSADERGTSKDDFLPVGVREKPIVPAISFVSAESGLVLRCERTAFNEYRATVEMRESGPVRLEQFWFPGWSAHVDRLDVAVTASTNSAVACCEVPAGSHVVEFKYIGLPEHRVGAFVSCASIASLVAILSIGGIRRRFGVESPP